MGCCASGNRVAPKADNLSEPSPRHKYYVDSQRSVSDGVYDKEPGACRIRCRLVVLSLMARASLCVRRPSFECVEPCPPASSAMYLRVQEWIDSLVLEASSPSPRQSIARTASSFNYIDNFTTFRRDSSEFFDSFAIRSEHLPLTKSVLAQNREMLRMQTTWGMYSSPREHSPKSKTTGIADLPTHYGYGAEVFVPHANVERTAEAGQVEEDTDSTTDTSSNTSTPLTAKKTPSIVSSTKMAKQSASTPPGSLRGGSRQSLGTCKSSKTKTLPESPITSTPRRVASILNNSSEEELHNSAEAVNVNDDTGSILMMGKKGSRARLSLSTSSRAHSSRSTNSIFPSDDEKETGFRKTRTREELRGDSLSNSPSTPAKASVL